HKARYDGERECIEMHLRSLRHQIVTLRDVDRRFVFEEGQTVRTESSHKFRHEVIPEMARRVGFRFERQWIDEEWPFSESLWTAVWARGPREPGYGDPTPVARPSPWSPPSVRHSPRPDALPR